MAAHIPDSEEHRVVEVMNLARVSSASTGNLAQALSRADLETMFVSAIKVVQLLDYALLSIHTSRDDMLDVALTLRPDDA